MDKLLKEARSIGVTTMEVYMPDSLKGLYSDGVIWINNLIPTRVEKKCILAEELGHHHTTTGDITDQSHSLNRKQERRAREWAYNRLIPLERIVEAHKAKVKGRFEFSEYLGVTEQFLQDSINRYIDKYGLIAIVDRHYAVVFEPLSVIEMFEIAE